MCFENKLYPTQVRLLSRMFLEVIKKIKIRLM
jgi:hypothetical protein